MMLAENKNCFFISAGLHGFLLFLLILGFDFATPMAVLENINKNDVISAVILGDTATSKILPQKAPTPPPPPPEVKKEIKPLPPPKPTKVSEHKDAIPLKKIVDKKKLVEQKALEDKLRKELFGKNLLADIKKQTIKPKKTPPPSTKNPFQKLLREQAEQSLRQQLLNEEIKLQGTESRQSQGEVNKYKALIIQAISERWVVPPGANKDLSCELMIRVAPGGMVIDVQVTKSSGDPALDSSARVAVLKASPLPVPPSADAFASFRQFALKVKPINILG